MPTSFSTEISKILLIIPMNLAVTYVEGTDGFPAFSISNQANLHQFYKLIVPEKLGESGPNKK